MEEITAIISADLKVSYSEMIAQKCRKKVTWARYISMYMIRELTGATQLQTGIFFERTQRTVEHACTEVRNRIASDEDFKTKIEELKEKILALIISL